MSVKETLLLITDDFLGFSTWKMKAFLRPLLGRYVKELEGISAGESRMDFGGRTGVTGSDGDCCSGTEAFLTNDFLHLGKMSMLLGSECP